LDFLETHPATRPLPSLDDVDIGGRIVHGREILGIVPRPTPPVPSISRSLRLKAAEDR